MSKYLKRIDDKALREMSHRDFIQYLQSCFWALRIDCDMRLVERTIRDIEVHLQEDHKQS